MSEILDEKRSGNIRAQLIAQSVEPNRHGWQRPDFKVIAYSVACYSDEWDKIIYEPIRAIALSHLGFGREVETLSKSLLPERWQNPDPTSLLAATQETPE